MPKNIALAGIANQDALADRVAERVADCVAALPWPAIAADLDARGVATTGPLLRMTKKIKSITNPKLRLEILTPARSADPRGDLMDHRKGGGTLPVRKGVEGLVGQRRRHRLGQESRPRQREIN